ncbi:hypothetical protein [Lentzea sp. E54]|uniref:hypothetical protein n=1 Tax=Lentzea xerophila TaxID=3435883 RepID=UPI003DA4347E
MTFEFREVWRGDVARAVGLLGLLSAIWLLGATVFGMLWVQPDDQSFLWAVQPSSLPYVCIIIALVLLVYGKFFPAKVVAGAALGLAWLWLPSEGVAPVWFAFQLPLAASFVFLCTGFNRGAPTPSGRRLMWWFLGVFALNLLAYTASLSSWAVIAVGVLGMRVAALVLGDPVLGRALSLLAALLMPMMFVIYSLMPGRYSTSIMVAGVALLVSALAPVRRSSDSRSRLL